MGERAAGASFARVRAPWLSARASDGVFGMVVGGRRRGQKLCVGRRGGAGKVTFEDEVRNLNE